MGARPPRSFPASRPTIAQLPAPIQLPLLEFSYSLSFALPKSGGRDLFIPCAIDWTEGDVHPVIPGGMGSHFVASLVGISAIIHLPLDHGKTQPGDLVPVILLKV